MLISAPLELAYSENAFEFAIRVLQMSLRVFITSGGTLFGKNNPSCTGLTSKLLIHLLPYCFEGHM